VRSFLHISLSYYEYILTPYTAGFDASPWMGSQSVLDSPKQQHTHRENAAGVRSLGFGRGGGLGIRERRRRPGRGGGDAEDAVCVLEEEDEQGQVKFLKYHLTHTCDM